MEFVCPIRSRAKGELLHVSLVRGIKQGGFQMLGMKSHEMNACPRPSGSWNQAGGTSSILYKVARNECLSSSIPFLKSSGREFVHPV